MPARSLLLAAVLVLLSALARAAEIPTFNGVRVSRASRRGR